MLNIKNHRPTIGPQILIFSYFDSLNLNIGSSGIIKKTKITTKQVIPPKYPKAQAVPENSP